MPSANMDELMVQPLGESKDREFIEWGDMYVWFERAPAGQDASAMFKGLPNDSCQCPHFGYLFKGKLLVRYDDHEEVFTAGQAFYIKPGHRPLGLEDYELLEFTPKAQFAPTWEATKLNMAKAK
jgi:hypothetical protein